MPISLPTRAWETEIARARTTLTKIVPYLVPATLRIPVHIATADPSTGVNPLGTSLLAVTPNNVVILNTEALTAAADDVEYAADAATDSASRRTLLTVLLLQSGYWKILSRHHTRGLANATDLTQPLWAKASALVAARDSYSALRMNFVDLDTSPQGFAHLPTTQTMLRVLDFDPQHYGFSPSNTTVEQVYNILYDLDMFHDPDPDPNEGSGEGTGEGSGSGNGTSEGEGSTGDGRNDPGTGEGAGNDTAPDSGAPGTSASDSDSGSGGDEPATDPGSGGSTGSYVQQHLPTFITTMEAEGSAIDAGMDSNAVSDLERAVAESAETYKNYGNALPEFVEQWTLTVLTPPVLNPYDILDNVVGGFFDTAAGGVEYTYRRPSRRYAAYPQPVVMPGRAAIKARVLVALDVSGSMSDADLIHGASEIAHIAQHSGLEVEYFSVSTMPHELRRLEPGGRPIVDRDHAGTDLRVAFDRFSMEHAHACVVITDGETPWPKSVDESMYMLAAIVTPDVDTYNRMCSRLPAGLAACHIPVDPRSAF